MSISHNALFYNCKYQKAVSKNDTAKFYAILNYSTPRSFLDASTRLSLMLSASLKSLPTAVM